MNKNYLNRFEGRSVLITGHTGFIGSWLAIILNELGANVIGYALSPYTAEDNYVVTHLEDKVTSIIGDIRDYNNVKKIFENYKPEIVYHLAAQPIVRKSYAIPKETFDINVGGTINIFEAFRKSKKIYYTFCLEIGIFLPSAFSKLPIVINPVFVKVPSLER